MEPDFQEQERHREDVLADEEARRARYESEPCEAFEPGGPENFVGEETCARCGFAEDRHG